MTSVCINLYSWIIKCMDIFYIGNIWHVVADEGGTVAAAAMGRYATTYWPSSGDFVFIIISYMHILYLYKLLNYNAYIIFI